MSRKRTLKEIQEDIRTLTRVPSEFIHAKLDELAEEVGELGNPGWIPCSERLPEDESYILVSFENEGVTLPDIATYKVDEQQGNRAFLPSDCEATYASVGLFVNAWMPLPKPHREG